MASNSLPNRRVSRHGQSDEHLEVADRADGRRLGRKTNIQRANLGDLFGRQHATWKLQGYMFFNFRATKLILVSAILLPVFLVL